MRSTFRRRRLPATLAALGVLLLAQSAAHGSQAGLVYPVDLVIADDGLVIADFKAPGLLSVDGTGNVAALALGSGRPRTPLYGTRAVVAAPDGDGWLVADPGTYGLYRVHATGTLETITTDLDIPQGIVRFDDTSVLVSDLRSGIGAIMRVTLAGEVSVFAQINSPKGIVADGDGFVVVSHGEQAIYRLGRDGTVTTLHQGAPLDFPHDIVRLPGGDFVVTDGYASALFRVSASGAVSVLTQGEPLVNPQGIARAADGSLFVADPQAGAVFRIDAAGAVEQWVSAGR